MPALVSFTMDNLGDAADLYRGVIDSPRAAGSNPPLEQGYPALLELFARYDIPLTCFIEGWSARQYPDYIERVLRHGHDIGMHGWTHERWSELPDAAVLELATRATDSIRAATGAQPLAFRAPGGKSTPYTNEVLSTLGYTIDASYTDSHVPAQLTPTLASLPYQWSGVDATHWLWNSRSGAETERRWRAALDEAAAANGHFIFIWHPHVMGIDAARLEAGARTLEFVRNDARFEVLSLTALNATLRDDYVEDCAKGVERWNRTLAPVGCELKLPHVGFHRAVGEFAGASVTPDGRVVSAEEWEKNRAKWLPTDDDQKYVESLMQPVREKGKMAGWVAPPASGLHGKPVDYEYVKL